MATNHDAIVNHSVLCENKSRHAKGYRNFLIMSPRRVVNPETYILNLAFLLNGGPGRYGTIFR